VSEQGVPIDEVTAKDFIMVRAALVRRLGGANEAIVWSRVFYRCDVDSRVAHDTETGRWWAATYDVVAAETGLSSKQARTALERLVADGFLTAEQHRLKSNYDQTYSYQPQVLGGQMDVPAGADEDAQGGDSGLPSGADAPSSETAIEAEEEESVAPEVQRLCSLLADLVRANGHRVGAVGFTWWQACDRLMRLDGLTADQVEILARWATSHEFWAMNVRSMPALRKHLDQIRAQRNRDLAKKPRQTTVEHGRSVDQILRDREAAAAGEQRAVSA
jgi:hypothetical protein